MREFYPPIAPYQTSHLKVSTIHEIYFEQVGNPRGTPILFLHGGPGGGINEDHRRYFDPQHYRIILFDQRGAGKSRPHAELVENTTWELVSDIEKLRAYLGISKWIVFGGSWGSTLALTYSIQHPDQVAGLVLRGIFLCRRSELLWFYQEGASQIFPDFWEDYFNLIPHEERGDLMAAYYKRVTHPDYSVRLQAAKVWSKWEAATSSLHVSQKAIHDFDDPDQALAFARIECHYFVNRAFFPTDNYILENIAKIRHIPGKIIQGRYDVVCPARSAWDLHRAWPEADFQFIPDSGHAAGEPGTRSALIQATDDFRRILI